MSYYQLTKREYIALEVLKSLLTTNQPNAVEASFDLADEFVKTSQATNVDDLEKDVNAFTAVSVAPHDMPTQTVAASLTPTQPAIPVFNHDYPKTRRN